MNCSDVPTVSKVICTWPATTSVSAGPPLIGHVKDVGAGQLLEQFGGQMRQCADTPRRIIERAGMSLCIGDQFGHGIERRRRIGDQHLGGFVNKGDRRKARFVIACVL